VRETQRRRQYEDVLVTTLTGERGQAGNADNSYTVVKSASGAVLDGFTVTGGNATPTPNAVQAPPSAAPGSPPSGPPPSGPPPGLGQGMPQGSAPPSGGAPVHQTPEIIHADAADDGQVKGAGGGISISSGMSVRNTEITNNTAVKGGGVYVMTSSDDTFGPNARTATPPPEVVLDNVNIHGNTASSRSGGVHVDVGSRVAMSNSNLSANHSDKGGGIGRCWPCSGPKVSHRTNTPVQTVHADFPHTAYQRSVGAQHYAALPFPGGLPG
jgi:hypothetical protein